MIERVGVAIILFDRNNPNMVALGRRNKKEAYGYWVNCGGKLEAGESPLDCACREAHEEFGVSLNILVPVSFVWVEEDNKKFLMLYYAAMVDSSEPRVASPAEFSDVQWFNVRELPKELMWGRDALMIACAHEQLMTWR